MAMVRIYVTISVFTMRIYKLTIIISIIFLDALKKAKFVNPTTVANELRKWLNNEWKNTIKGDSGKGSEPFTKDSMKLVTPKGKVVCLKLFY
jgi:hypothetical protein